MPAYLTNFFSEFVTLLVILDPVATVPLFLLVSDGLDRRKSILVAFHAVWIAFFVLVFFIVGGQFLLTALRIPMPSFQLAGSLILLLIAIKMVMGSLGEGAAALPAAASPLQRAIFPLAIPTLAGPGSMLTVVLLADNTVRSFGEQVATTGILALCLLVIFLTYALATVILRFMGKAGIEIVSRAFGLILASLAMSGIIESIKISFGLD